MGFLAPLMLLGLLGAAAPIVIHLHGRRRARVRPFATIDFLLGSDRRQARRFLLRDRLLLAARVLACVAMALVLAKPFLSCRAVGVAVERGPQAVALVLDDSFAMGYRLDGESLFDRAKQRALAVLRSVGPEADVALVLASDGAPPALELSRSQLKVADAIRAARPSHRPADMAVALGRAQALVGSSPHVARRVYLFSALSAGAFTTAEAAVLANVELRLVDVAEGTPLANVAIVGVRAEREPDLGARGVRVTAELVNHAAVAVVDRGVSLSVDGKVLARGVVSLPAGERAEKRFSVTLPGTGRAQQVVVELDHDALELDDRRWLSVEVADEVRTLLVNGDPRTIEHEDELHYLATALRPGDLGDSRIALTILAPDALAAARLEEQDVVVLANVAHLDEKAVAALARWVGQGGGLFITLGDASRADAWDGAMAALLPQGLHAPRLAAPGATGAERAARAERIGRFEAAHPIFAGLGRDGAGLLEARFHRIFLLDPVAGGDRRTLARFASGAPALVEAPLGKGRRLLFTSTIDRDWNDLPIHAAYLPFVQQAVRYLSRTPPPGEAQATLVGRTQDLAVLPGDRRVEVTAPDGQKTVFEGRRLEGRTRVPFVGTRLPGAYRVVAVDADGVSRPRSSSDFAVNIDPVGSDVRRAEAARLPQSANPTVTSALGQSVPTRRVDLWHGVAAALLLFLLGEALLTRRL